MGARDGRKHPVMPEPKGTTIVKFVMKDDPRQELDVVKENLTPVGLKILKKQGYVQATKLLLEQAKKAEEKDEKLDADQDDDADDEDDQDDDDSDDEPTPPAKSTPPAKTPGRVAASRAKE